jgi:hypothetical protein
MLFTRYKKINDDTEVKAIFWDGDYFVYKKLVTEDPDFVAVLDDGGRRGEDSIKLWNEVHQKWEVCKKGNYIVKEEKMFTVKSKEQILSELRKSQ